MVEIIYSLSVGFGLSDPHSPSNTIILYVHSWKFKLDKVRIEITHILFLSMILNSSLFY